MNDSGNPDLLPIGHISNPFHKLLPLCVESDKIKAGRIGCDLYIQVQLTRVDRNPVTGTRNCFNGDFLEMFTSPAIFVHT